LLAAEVGVAGMGKGVEGSVGVMGGAKAAGWVVFIWRRLLSRSSFLVLRIWRVVSSRRRRDSSGSTTFLNCFCRSEESAIMMSYRIILCVRLCGGGKAKREQYDQQ